MLSEIIEHGRFGGMCHFTVSICRTLSLAAEDKVDDIEVILKYNLTKHITD